LPHFLPRNILGKMLDYNASVFRRSFFFLIDPKIYDRTFFLIVGMFGFWLFLFPEGFAYFNSKRQTKPVSVWIT